MNYHELEKADLEIDLAIKIAEGFERFLERIANTEQKVELLGDNDTTKKVQKFRKKVIKKLEKFKKHLAEHPDEVYISKKGKKKLIKVIKYTSKKADKHEKEMR